MDNLIDIRCPFKKISKIDQQLYLCNRVCVKVTPGSSGEARCKNCHKSFWFQVDSQARNTTGIRVKSKDS